MHRDVHRFLDGEIPREALDAEAAAELRAWESLTDAVHADRRAVAPPAIEDSVMRAIVAASTLHGVPSALEAGTSPETAPEADRFRIVREPESDPVDAPAGGARARAALAWLVTPRPLRMPPIVPAAAAALVLFLGVEAVRDDGIAPPDATQMAQANTVYVQFALEAGDAETVAVAGDFNGWSADTGTLRDADGDGVWSGVVAVEPGVHRYMFVINGREWVTDPVAERYVDDGFGMRNALLAVGTPGEAT